ncbi:MAG TPA: aldo/keto reductase [Polyangiales bacterium]|nr:aldo/keto reductase [Polyangiales bacterium]
MQRRQLLWGLPVTLASAWLTRSWLSKARAAPGSASKAIPRRALGSTGEQVSMVGLGGYHIGVQKDARESIRIIRTALDAGVNFLDNCWDYNDGESERRMGQALRDGYRDKAFVMSKIDGRNRAAAAKQIDESLQRLQTDRIDLMQVHEVIRDSDPERVFAAGGAMEALIAAQKAGKIRYLGFTGHKSAAIHAKMLSVAAQHNFKFDTVQMPLNVMDAHDDGFEKRILPLLTAQKIGVLGMKPLGSGIILKSGKVSAIQCLHYAMSLPTSVVITGCDSMRVLQQALTAARTWKPLAAAARDALLARTAKPSAEKRYELYKTSQQFDGTEHNPHWLG